MLQTYQAASLVSPHVVDLFHLSRKISAALDNLPAIVTFCGANLGGPKNTHRFGSLGDLAADFLGCNLVILMQ